LLLDDDNGLADMPDWNASFDDSEADVILGGGGGGPTTVDAATVPERTVESSSPTCLAPPAMRDASTQVYSGQIR
jgi:hypothetical protein